MPHRTTLRALLAGVLPVAALLLFSGAGQAQQSSGGDGPSVLDGVFSRDQAARGDLSFRRNCAGCHLSQEFADPILWRSWHGRSAGDIVNQIAASMPVDAPGSLSRDVYTDIVAYMLRLRGYPAGDGELSSESAVQSTVRIEPAP